MLIEDINEEKNESTIAALNGYSVVHKTGQFMDDALQNEHVYVNLSDDIVEEVKYKVKHSIQKTTGDGLLSDGTERLEVIINRSKLVLEIRLGNKLPAIGP